MSGARYRFPAPISVDRRSFDFGLQRAEQLLRAFGRSPIIDLLIVIITEIELSPQLTGRQSKTLLEETGTYSSHHHGPIWRAFVVIQRGNVIHCAPDAVRFKKRLIVQ
jgi:hypothetical protein